MDRGIESGNAGRLSTRRSRTGLEADPIYERSITRFNCQIGAGRKRRGFLERLDRHVEADRNSVNARNWPPSFLSYRGTPSYCALEARDRERVKELSRRVWVGARAGPGEPERCRSRIRLPGWR